MFDQANESNRICSIANKSTHYIVISFINITLFNWIVFATLVQIFAVFGVISNVVNIVCFIKQGFKDSINVSLTGEYYMDRNIYLCMLPYAGKFTVPMTHNSSPLSKWKSVL